MYTPYANQQQQPNIIHPQPQHVQHQVINPNHNPQLNQVPSGQFNATPYSNFLSDPTAAMGAQFAQSTFNASNQYIKQNLNSLIPVKDLNYYFKISNSYVLKKLWLIVFPYRNKHWTRLSATSSDQSQNPVELFAPPLTDVMAPDLYIPLMGFITYTLLWVIFAGAKGEFHPELFGLAASKTLACSLFDIAILKLGFYLLSCDIKIWDIVAYSGYKYVSIIIILLFKHLVYINGFVCSAFLLTIFFSLGFFMLKSIRSLISYSRGQSITSKDGKNVIIQSLFLYCGIQLGLVWLMT